MLDQKLAQGKVLLQKAFNSEKFLKNLIIV